MDRKFRGLNYCGECGTQLRFETCLSCQGTGQTTQLIFFRRDCEQCNATGNILRCPNPNCSTNSLSLLIEKFSGKKPDYQSPGAKQQVDDEGAKKAWWKDRYWRR